MNCQRCGRCCRELIIEADWFDIAREPRIANECPRLDGHGTVPKDEWKWSIAVCSLRPCPFLQDGNVCTIYETRPSECRDFLPGCDKCRELRGELQMADRSEP